MKHVFVLLCVISSVSAFAQTQMEINMEAHQEFLKADSPLNDVYQKILIKYQDDSAFIANTQITQRIWIKFRDAQMTMMFPEWEYGYYGSMHPMCWSFYKKELTEQRTTTLKLWTESEEEEHCGGTPRTKD